MNVGMLWFDNDSKADLTTKLNRAVSYYQNKYGQRPNLCFVHPTMLKDSPSKEDGIEVRTTRSVRWYPSTAEIPRRVIGGRNIARQVLHSAHLGTHLAVISAVP